MKYGIREICDVVLKARAEMTVGNRTFYKNEPVIYFDTLKTSSLEGAATTVYAQGGKGNARLMAWEGEKTVTFTMEDALISPIGLSILTGAGLVEATETEKVYQHITETKKVTVTLTDEGKLESATVDLSNIPYCPNKAAAGGQDWIYVMKLDEDGNVASEPYIFERVDTTKTEGETEMTKQIKNATGITFDDKLEDGDAVLVDYYIERTSGVKQIEITPDSFGGNFYLEASTLFRDTNGQDVPAEFVIPNCKVQSNFNFSMASSGDPSTFTFTMDAFPAATRFSDKKVLSLIQIIDGEDNTNNTSIERTETDTETKFGID